MSMTRSEAGRVGAYAAHKKWGSKHMTEKGRAANMARFKSDEEKTEYYRELGRQSQAARRKS